MAGRRVLVLTVLLMGCQPRTDLLLDSPTDGAYVTLQGSLPVAARFDGARSISLEVDGLPGPILTPSPDGEFRGRVEGLSPGRHDLVARLVGAPGTSAQSTLYCDRLADAPISGRGFSSDGEWLFTLSSASPGPGGLYEGHLTLTDVAGAFGGFHRVLSENGVFADSFGDEVGWVEDWQGDAQGGTLFLSPIAGGPEQAVPDVRSFQFAGSSVAAVDAGLLLLTPPYATPLRLAPVVQAAGFVGPADDLIAFVPAGTTPGAPSAYQVEVAPSPGFATLTLPPLFQLQAWANRFRRQIALAQWSADARGGALELYDLSSGASTIGPPGPVSAAFSPDGSYFAALAGRGGQELWIAPALAGAAFERIPGLFIGGIYDPTSTRLAALTSGGTLLEVELATLSISTAAQAVTDFRPLEQGALVWSEGSGETWLRTPAGAVVDLGTFNPQGPQFAFVPGAFAFTALEGLRQPVRRVDVATGTYADFGEMASAPTFLADQAFAWLERRADAESGGFANEDLWLLPALPEGLSGPRAVAQRVWAADPFAISPDGRSLLLLEGAPPRGEFWHAQAACLSEQGALTAMGESDPSDHSLFWTADGRTGWIGADGTETGVLFLRSCP